MTTPNKRKAHRLKTNIPFKYFVHTGREEIIKDGTILEISAENLLFKSPEGISIGDRVKFEVSLPTIIDIVRGWGGVSRLDYDEKLAALDFDQLEESSQKQIQTFLERSELIRLLQIVLEEGASDLHLSVGHKPYIRVGGELRPVDYAVLSGIMTKKIIYSMLNEDQKLVFEKRLELDSSFTLSPVVRFRYNVHFQRGNVEIVFHRIESHIRSLEELGLPPVVAQIARKKSGLLLITGTANTGKTTTASSIINLINAERSAIILTLEDPIEYVHEFKKSIVKQREIGLDTKSFPVALKHALRQDPDVILIGEIRDAETMTIALAAAESGHLVLGTMSAQDAVQAVSQIIALFPHEQQLDVRRQLADVLLGIVYQLLLPHGEDATNRVLATEILTATPSVRSLIRDQKLEQIPLAMQTGSQHGMHTLDSSLEQLLRRRQISMETVSEYCREKHKFGIKE